MHRGCGHGGSRRIFGIEWKETEKQNDLSKSNENENKLNKEWRNSIKKREVSKEQQYYN